MPQVDRAGIFKVEAGGKHGLEEKDSGAVCIAIKFQLTHMLAGSEWQDWSQYRQDAWARVWLFKKDGTPNDIGIATARDVLGWDGDLESIGGDGWVIPACQISVRPQKDDPSKLEVSYINPMDYVPTGGGPKTAPADKVRDLKSRFGNQLRAVYGMRPTVAAPKALPPPLPTRTGTATLPPPPVKATGIHGTRARAWTHLVEMNAKAQKPVPSDQLSEVWQLALSGILPGRDEATLTPADWLKVEKEAPGFLPPF